MAPVLPGKRKSTMTTTWKMDRKSLYYEIFMGCFWEFVIGIDSQQMFSSLPSGWCGDQQDEDTLKSSSISETCQAPCSGIDVLSSDLTCQFSQITFSLSSKMNSFSLCDVYSIFQKR